MSPLALIAAVLVVLTIEILFQAVVVRLSVAVFENRPPIGAEVFPPDSTAVSAAFTTRDRLQLVGSLWRSGCDSPRGLVLFCHELDSNRWSAMSYCEGLLAAGFHVFTFDFRNHGDSQSLAGYSPFHWATDYEVEDVLSAVAYLKSQPELAELPLGLFGISRGGTAAVAAAARCELVRCVATDGAVACNFLLEHYVHRWGRLYFNDRFLRSIPRWHELFSLWLIRRVSEFRRGMRYANIERSLAQLRNKPVLLISGERDTYIFPEMTRRLFALTGQDASRLWIVPQAKHNMARQTALQEYDSRLIEFFSLLDPAAFAATVSHAAVSGGDDNAPFLNGSPSASGRASSMSLPSSFSSSG